MQRRTFIRATGLTAGMMALSSRDMMANIFQQPVFTMKMIRNNVGYFTERGGTIGYHLSGEDIVVIDSEFPDQARHLIDELKKQNDHPFRFLINTHHHGDHTGGNIAFKDMAEHVVGHENCLANYRRVAEQQKSTDKQLFQDITFKDGWKQQTGRESIRAYYFGPAHTNGDAIIHFENANVVHMGDLMFNQMHPFVDRSAGASMKNWILVLQKARGTFNSDTVFIFGHAADPAKVTGTKEDLLAFEEYLQKLLTFVDGEIKAGKSKDDILKNKEIPGVSWKASGAERPLGAAYDELTAM